MFRRRSAERPGWRQRAEEFGFGFHTMYGEPYWDESAYYEFTLREIEDDLEDPTAELHRMCLEVVDRVVHDEALLARFQIPQRYRKWVRQSWQAGDKSLYSRLDLAYSPGGTAKLLENNADTPTSLYESGFWQWLWLEDKLGDGTFDDSIDQFNSVQEKVVERFRQLHQQHLGALLHVSCCRDTVEDRGTVQYLQDCAREAGIETEFVYVEDIGRDAQGRLSDTKDQVIAWMFKLYPWEFMMRESFGELMPNAPTGWLEPPWKSVLSNKALLPLLWEMFPEHPNLLPAYFEDDPRRPELARYVRKPIFAREGCNVSIHMDGKQVYASDGPYGDEGFIIQEYVPLPRFGDSYTLIGSWLIGDQPAGISVREDSSAVTQDLSRYLPHVIRG